MPDLHLAWQLDPVLLGSLVTLATLFALSAGPLRGRLAPGRPFPIRSAALFYAALLLIYLLEGSPLHDLAESYSLTAHMIQHLGIAYLAAPLLLWSVPPWMWRSLLLNRAVAPLARGLTRPLVAFAVFSLSFSAWHLPSIYDAALRNSSLHHAEHVGFLLVSLLLWWPLASRLPELPREGHLVRLIYLFLLPVAQIPVFGTITFADRALYDTYAQAVWTLGMDPVEEQALAGAAMKIAGLFAFGIPFGVIFFRWYQHENRPRVRDGTAAVAPESGGAAEVP